MGSGAEKLAVFQQHFGFAWGEGGVAIFLPLATPSSVAVVTGATTLTPSARYANMTPAWREQNTCQLFLLR